MAQPDSLKMWERKVVKADLGPQVCSDLPISESYWHHILLQLTISSLANTHIHDFVMYVLCYTDSRIV